MAKLIFILIFLPWITCHNDYNHDEYVAGIIYNMMRKSRTGYSLRKTQCITNYEKKYGIAPLTFTKLGNAESSFRHTLITTNIIKREFFNTNTFETNISCTTNLCVGTFQISLYWWSHLAWVVCDGRYANYLNRHKGTNVANVLKFIEANTHCAAIILREYLDMYDGDYVKALLKFGGFKIKRYNEKSKDIYLNNIMGVK